MFIIITIVVVFLKIDDAKNIKNLLVRNGFPVAAVCATGAQAIHFADGMNDGIIVCGYKLKDMLYTQLADDLPQGFELLLMASSHIIGACDQKSIMSLTMPAKLNDLLSTVEMMSVSIARRRKRMRGKPKERNVEDLTVIKEAKQVLMNRNHMTEEEAHKYIQKCSMDSGTNIVETAHMVLSMMDK